MHHETLLAPRGTFGSGTICLVRAECRCPSESKHIIVKLAGSLSVAAQSALPSARCAGQQQAGDPAHYACPEPLGMSHASILSRVPRKRVLSNHVQWGWSRSTEA